MPGGASLARAYGVVGPVSAAPPGNKKPAEAGFLLAAVGVIHNMVFPVAHL